MAMLFSDSITESVTSTETQGSSMIITASVTETTATGGGVLKRWNGTVWEVVN